MMCFGVDFFGFFLFGVHSTSVCWFCQIWGILAIISLNIPQSHPFSPRCGGSSVHTVGLLLFHMSLRFCLFFSSLFSLLFRSDKFYWSVFKSAHLSSAPGIGVQAPLWASIDITLTGSELLSPCGLPTHGGVALLLSLSMGRILDSIPPSLTLSCHKEGGASHSLRLQVEVLLPRGLHRQCTAETNRVVH